MGARSGTLVVTIHGFDMPGRSCDPLGTGERYNNVHVGVQQRREVVNLVSGDSPDARWSFDVTSKTAPDGSVDFGGPFVHGRLCDRFLYLSWGAVDGDFRMFRRAKLHFADCHPDVIAAALRCGELSCRVRMTDARGLPRCARVRPPDAMWAAPPPT